MSDEKQNTILFRLGNRLSVLTGLLTFVSSLLIIGFTLNWSYAFRYSLLIAILTYLIVYFLTILIIKPKLKRLNKNLFNLSDKNFSATEKSFVLEKDEIDRLYNLTISTNSVIEREIQRLKKIENYRKEFIGDVSHELKTPIFAIQGFIETLLNGALEDESVNREFLKKAMRNVNRLIYLTNDLMEISKLETGDARIHFQNLLLKPMILEIVENLQYKAEREHVTVVVNEIDDELTVMAERNQIRQVLNNLIDNAIKYNKEGGMVFVGVRPFLKNRAKVEIYVKDTGIGIDKKDITRITERFFRVDKSRSREKGGTGLGLSIVKHMLEAHDEELFIDSTPQSGSTFSFTLQKAKPASSKK